MYGKFVQAYTCLTSNHKSQLKNEFNLKFWINTRIFYYSFANPYIRNVKVLYNCTRFTRCRGITPSPFFKFWIHYIRVLKKRFLQSSVNVHRAINTFTFFPPIKLHWLIFVIHVFKHNTEDRITKYHFLVWHMPTCQ